MALAMTLISSQKLKRANTHFFTITLVFTLAIGALFLFPKHSASEEKPQQEKALTPQEKLERFKQKSVDELIAHLQSHPGALHVVHRLTQLGDKKAIPALKGAFERVEDKHKEQTIARALVALAEEDEFYWNFLVQYAKVAIESDMPFPLPFDSKGRGIKGKLSLEFLAWAEENKVDPKVAAETGLYEMSHDVKVLAMAGDPRAFDLLLRGLESKNYLIASYAAQGLAKLQDKRAIRPIIQASKMAPAEAADFIARPLVFFDDPEAQRAAEEFIQNKVILDSLRKRAKEKDAYRFFHF